MSESIRDGRAARHATGRRIGNSPNVPTWRFLRGQGFVPASPGCETPVTISTDQGVFKRLVFTLLYITSLVIITKRLGGRKHVILGHTEQLEVSSFPKQMNEASEMRLQLT